MFSKGFQFYVVLAVLSALAAVGFLWGARTVDVGHWPRGTALLALLFALRAATLVPAEKRWLALVFSGVLTNGILFGGSAVVHALPPVLVTERVTVTTTESWNPSREELVSVIEQMRVHIETTEDGCELLAVDDPATGMTGVQFLSHGSCSFRLAREGRQ